MTGFVFGDGVVVAVAGGTVGTASFSSCPSGIVVGTGVLGIDVAISTLPDTVAEGLGVTIEVGEVGKLVGATEVGLTVFDGGGSPP